MESCPKKYSEEFFRTVRSHFPRFDMSPVHRCLVWASAEWQRQATTGEEESGPVKTGVRFFFLVAKATPIKCLVSGPPPAFIFENLKNRLLLLRMAKWAIYSTASCSCHGSEKTLVNAVVKTQWVAPHIVSHRQTRAYNGGLAYRLSGSGEYRSTSNALPVL